MFIVELLYDGMRRAMKGVLRYALVVAICAGLLLSGDDLERSSRSNGGWRDTASADLNGMVQGGRGTDLSTSEVSRERPVAQRAMFYILPMPEITTWLVGNFTQEAVDYYETALNEEQAEVWLHRGMVQQLSDHRTEDPTKADVVIVAGYLHFNRHMLNAVKTKGDGGVGVVPYTTDEWLACLKDRLVPHKLHVIAIPTWNPTRGNAIGLAKIKNALQAHHVRRAAFGFERNVYWQKTAPPHIVPVPYVVTPDRPRAELRRMATQHTHRTGNSVFYAGDARPRAVQWAGCNRTRLILPLQQQSSSSSSILARTVDVRIVDSTNRLTQAEYNARLSSSDYCLILCGDTPSSRSLASAMLYGCIPVRVGSRLRGACDAPCHAGWGWSVTNQSHLPYARHTNWTLFPEVDEAAFAHDAAGTLHDLFARTDARRKDEMRSIMSRVQMAWVYGWGSPVTSNDFGEAVPFAWDSLVDYLIESGIVSA